MNRRKYLSTVASLSVIPTLSQKKHSDNDDTSESNRCVTINDNTAPFRVPSDDADFVVSGEPDVNVYWKSQQFFNELGYITAQAIARVGGLNIILNEDKQEFIDDYILLHELAHCRGYHHGDGGIVDTNTAWFPSGDRTGTTLEESTREVANSYDAYEIYSEWDIDTLGTLGTEFAQDRLTVNALGTAGKRVASNSNIEDLHIKHSHNGFGSIYDSGPQPDFDNIYAGQFYKSE